MSDQERQQAEHRAALVRGLMRELHEARAAKDEPAIRSIVAALNELDDRPWRVALGGQVEDQEDQR